MQEWGRWECPMCMNGEKISDPDDIYITTCGAGHVVLLGPVNNGHRWAQPYEPSEYEKQLIVKEHSK